MSIAHIGELQDNLGEELYLGPATVTGIRGLRVVVAPPGGQERPAELAVAFPYNPTRGDEVLVIGKDERLYVIGVLEAKGTVSLRFQGDVDLHAVGGKLRLLADEEVVVRTPSYSVHAEKVMTIAETVIDKATNLFQNVREMVSTRAGEKQDLVDGEWHTRAERAAITTRGITTINGKEVHLN